MATSPFPGHEPQGSIAHVTPSVDVPSPTLVGSTLAETTQATSQQVLVSQSREPTLPLDVSTSVQRDPPAHGSSHINLSEPRHTEFANFESLSFTAMLTGEEVPITSLHDTTLRSHVQGESTQAQQGHVPSPTGLEEHAGEAHLSVSHTSDSDQVTGNKTSHAPTDEGKEQSNPNDSGNPSAPVSEDGEALPSSEPVSIGFLLDLQAQVTSVTERMDRIEANQSEILFILRAIQRHLQQSSSPSTTPSDDPKKGEKTVSPVPSSPPLRISSTTSLIPFVRNSSPLGFSQFSHQAGATSSSKPFDIPQPHILPPPPPKGDEALARKLSHILNSPPSIHPDDVNIYDVVARIEQQEREQLEENARQSKADVNQATCPEESMEELERRAKEAAKLRQARNRASQRASGKRKKVDANGPALRPTFGVREFFQGPNICIDDLKKRLDSKKKKWRDE